MDKNSLGKQSIPVRLILGIDKYFKKILLGFFLILVALNMLWAGVGYLWFHTSEAVYDEALIESTQLKRPTVTDVEIIPRIIQFRWGLKNYMNRSASRSSDKYIDKNFVQSTSGTVYLGHYECTIKIRDGNVNQFIVNTRSTNKRVNDYIQQVIEDFSGDFSTWADVDLKIRIDKQTITITPILFNKKQELVSGNTQRAVCPLGEGQVRYDGIGQPHQIVASRGYRMNMDDSRIK